MFDKLEELRIYQQAVVIADLVWNEVAAWDRFARQALGYQLISASDSIAANIAEGYGRYHYKEFIHHLYIARGSLFETMHWIKRAETRNLIKKEKTIFEKCKALLPQLQAYISSRKKIGGMYD